MDTYKATNTTNGKFYIGSTKNFEKRKKGHLQSKDNYPFQNALRKNPEAFEWECWSDDSDEPILEQALLDMWFGTEQCYNLNPSAEHPPQNSFEQNQNIGLKNVELGRGCFSEEYRNSEERKELYKKIGRENAELGRGFCDPEYQASEDAQKIRERGAARAAEVCSKRVKLTSIGGTETLFKSLTEASVVLGVSKNTLMKYANNFPDKPMKKGAAKGSCIEYV